MMARIARPALCLLAALLAGCYVTRAPQRPIVPAAAPLPLTVVVCGNTTGYAPAELLTAARLVRAVTTDPTAPADLTVEARLVKRRDRTLVSFGFFLWTVGVIPWVTSAERDVELAFRRPAPGINGCLYPERVGGESGEPALVIRGDGSITSVQGWLGLALQPTPWWSSGAVTLDRPPGELSDNLRLRVRASVARAGLRHADALRRLAAGGAS